MSSYVYFIQQGAGGPIKIGVTSNVAQRLQALQTANPNELTLLGYRPGGARDEALLHQEFAQSRLRGEWCTPCTRLIQYATEYEKDAQPDVLPKLLMNQAEAAAMLGMSVNTFKANVRPYIKRVECQGIRFPVSELEAWVARNAA